ncbi:MAG: GNAT family N-acetyltransferase [Elusimicrobiota bacterium]
MPEIRTYRPGDEAGIRRLFEICHLRPLEADVWSWRYAYRPEGSAVTMVAVDRGELVGHVSALPIQLERGTRAVKAGLWVDLMIEPKHRNLTLFLDLADANRRRSAELGVELLFAFPNDKSYPVLKRMLGWQDAGDIPALEGALSSLSAPEPAGSKIEAIEEFGAEFDGLWSRLRPQNRLCGARGSERLRWRYRSRPRSLYPAWSVRGAAGGLEGFLVAKVFEGPKGRIGDILEFWAEPKGPAAGSLLAAAFGHFKNENVGTVSAWALQGTPQRAKLEACGLAPGADRTHFAGRWTAERGPDFPVRHADWSISKGDSDVF